MRYLVYALVLALLYACGAKGPLQLPDRNKQEQQKKEEKQQ